MGNSNLVFENLFKAKISAAEKLPAYLGRIAEEYPYFSPAQFLLLQQMKTGTPEYDRQVAKTSILFNNPYWLNFQLQETGAISDEQSGYFPVETNEVQTGQIEKPGEEATDTSEPYFNEPPGERENISEAGTGEATVDTAIANEDKIEEDTALDTSLIKGDNFETLQVETGNENIAEGDQTVNVGTTGDQQEITAPESVNDEHYEQNITLEPPIDLDTKPVDASLPLQTVPAVTEEIEAEKEPEKIAVNETIATNTEEMDAEELPLTEEDLGTTTENKPLDFKLNLQPVTTTEENITFEPLHTTDYFASLGIKLSNEVKPTDKLGKQLKSFTEWLKTMKKIHTEQLNQSSGQSDKVIQTLAEKSNTEDEVLTEAMAEVLLQQGKNHKAIEVYKKLSLLNPSKNAYFAAKIDQLKQ